MVLSWNSAQAMPVSTSTRDTVFLANPVMRTVDRREQPSIRQPMILDRSAIDNWFMWLWGDYVSMKKPVLFSGDGPG